MTEAETQDLIRRYKLTDGTGLINYRDFVNKADKVFSDEADPSAAINAARSTAVSYKSFDFNLNLNRCIPMKRKSKCIRQCNGYTSKLLLTESS